MEQTTRALYCNPIWSRIFPFLRWWPLVTRDTLKADLIAGLTGAVVVLPQGVAFAMIAGLPPVYGLYTAMVPPIIAALFGSSRHLISGPTTAISIVVFATVAKFADPGSAKFIQMALTLTFLAGVYQLALGLARMGTLVNFISHSVVVGFTAGAAVLIATSQLKHYFGMHIPSGESFLHTWRDIFQQIDDANLYVTGIASITLVSLIVLMRLKPRWPVMLVAMVLGSVVAMLLGATAHGVRVVGQLPQHLPPLSMPDLHLAALKQLGSAALAIAMLGLVEAVSIARSVAAKSGQRIDGSQEFVGQGLANVVGSFFSSYASSGSFTRSGLNYTAGAVTPLSGVFAALALALIVLLVAPLAAHLPIAAMAAVLLVVAWRLIDFHHIKTISRPASARSRCCSTTFFATLFVELEFAIYVGVMLSLIIYLMRTSQPAVVAARARPGQPAPSSGDRPESAGVPAAQDRARRRFALLRRGRPRAGAAAPASTRRSPAAETPAADRQWHQFRRHRRRRAAGRRGPQPQGARRRSVPGQDQGRGLQHPAARRLPRPDRTPKTFS